MSHEITLMLEWILNKFSQKNRVSTDICANIYILLTFQDTQNI